MRQEKESSLIESAKLYIKKVGNTIKSFWRYITHEGGKGKIDREEPHKLTKEELEDLKVKCPELYEALMTGNEVEIERYENEE